ncbi:MAG: 4Fe-4S binding protein [Firmicutes bacterium]|nr:4Fe-4S binding protein [Candidatus Fermentithermobacillaceae bacterium]
MRDAKATRALLYGNEAIARGAWEAGVKVAAGYPGTPSTEIIESLAGYDGIHVEWSTNEKVALEVAIGASIAGARALATMKHVGLNVAADPLMTVSYMGVNAGLVIVSADDPGMHSSQNEQDNRWYGRFAGVPVLEPSDSAEALCFTKQAFEISEKFDVPVIVRSVTRISHARSLVELGDRVEPEPRPYRKDPRKYVMLPAHAKGRKPVVVARVKELQRFADESPINRVEWGSTERGFITGGISYQYVKEAFPHASVLKLGMSYPLPERLIRDFASKVRVLYVVEELDPFWEDIVKAMGIPCHGKDAFPAVGELSRDLVIAGVEKIEGTVAVAGVRPGDARGPAATGSSAAGRSGEDGGPEGDQAQVTLPGPGDLPARPPVLCPGCPHRPVFYVLKKLGLTVTGDIGCYTLGALPPLAAKDTTTCMGASIGHASGMSLGLPPEQAARVVAVIGDSTFLHSGLTPLINMTYNQVWRPVIILDNGTTAMTGHQGHPATGYDARKNPAPRISLEEIVSACGAKSVSVVDPYDVKSLERTIREALKEPASVVIARRACVLLPRQEPKKRLIFKAELCRECGLCLQPACPALEPDGKRPKVNEVLCTACGVCAELCPRDALVVEAEEVG